MANGSTEILVTVPEAQLHEVNGGEQRLLEWGQLSLSIQALEDVSGLWLKIGQTEWNFDSTTPVLKAADHTFMFAIGGGRFYSVLLAKGTPTDVAATLEEILVECSSFEYSGAMSKQATDAAVSEVAQEVVDDEDLPLVLSQAEQEAGHKRTPSDRIMSGAAAAQAKLLASANWASQKLLDSSRAMQAKTEPSNAINVSPQMQQRVKLARRAAEKGNRAANRVAGGIADISVKMADSIVKRLGPNNKFGQQLNDPETRPSAAKEVAAAAVVAAVGIYDSMEQAARIVLNSGGQATSEFIGHKYGQDAGQVVKDATSASVTAGLTAMTMQKIGVRKIARRIAKRTAVGLAKTYVLSPGQKQQGLPGNGPQTHAANPGLQQAAHPQMQGQSSAAYPQPGAAQMQGHSQAAQMQATYDPNVMASSTAPMEYCSPFSNSK